MSLPRIAVDAMGGDEGVRTMISGAALARRRHDQFSFLLVGDGPRIERALEAHPNMREASEILHCDDVVGGDEKPTQAWKRSGLMPSICFSMIVPIAPPQAEAATKSRPDDRSNSLGSNMTKKTPARVSAPTRHRPERRASSPTPPATTSADSRRPIPISSMESIATSDQVESGCRPA